MVTRISRTKVRLLRAATFLGVSTFLVSVGLMVSACAVTGPKHISGTPLGPQPVLNQLTLLSWNIHKGCHPDLADNLDLAIKTHDPDFLFLQEACPGLALDHRVGGVFAPAWRMPLRANGSTGVFTASRKLPIESQAVRSHGREFGVTFPKVALVTHHALDDDRVLLGVNVHVLNFEHGKPKRFARQLEALRVIMSEHVGPMILAGDFNTWSTARDEHLRDLTESLGLSEVDPLGAKRKTGDRGSNFWNGALGIDPTLPLDRIFYRGLEVASAQVLDLESSDHAPLLVTFLNRPGA